jgi:hypothetical protein
VGAEERSARELSMVAGGVRGPSSSEGSFVVMLAGREEKEGGREPAKRGSAESGFGGSR